jgi:hypothetical protein
MGTERIAGARWRWAETMTTGAIVGMFLLATAAAFLYMPVLDWSRSTSCRVSLALVNPMGKLTTLDDAGPRVDLSVCQRVDKSG